MSKFLKLIFSGAMIFVFVFGSVSVVDGIKNKNQHGDWIVQGGKSNRRISSIDELCTRPWRTIEQIQLSDYFYNDLNQNDKTKYKILEKLKQLNELRLQGQVNSNMSRKKKSSNCNNEYRLSFSGVNMKWCRESVGAKNFDEYVSKAQTLFKTLLECKTVNERCSFDQNGVFGCVTLTAVVTENNEKYFLALGLDKSDNLSIVAFYKFSSEDEVKRNIIDGLGMIPWRELKNIRLPIYNVDDLSEDYRTKYKILKNLKKSKDLWAQGFVDEKSKVDHCNWHGNGVGAGKDADKYLGKAQAMIETLFGRTNERLDEVKYKFTEDQINRVALTAIISKDSDKYFLALGLNGEDLCIKTFYKFSSKKIKESLDKTEPLLCKIITRYDWNYAEFEDISIWLNNAGLEAEGNIVNIKIDSVDEDGKPEAHILSKDEITSKELFKKCVLVGSVYEELSNAFVVYNDRYKLYVYIANKDICEEDLDDNNVKFIITAKGPFGFVGSMYGKDGRSLNKVENQ